MFKRPIAWLVSITFVFSVIGPYKPAQADVLGLPVPGSMVNLSPAYEPTLIKGLTVHKDNPFLFDFIVDTGHSGLSGDALKTEGDRLVKYFFACLTIPEKDLWVNLSPYEKDRMIPNALGQTALGRDLLAQDYILKQLTASLIYPEKNLGKEFWNRVYARAQAEYGTTQIPVNTFNKVWILADKASVYENGQTAFVLEGHLKVMLEEDYLALSKHADVGAGSKPAQIRDGLEPSPTDKNLHSVTSKIIRQIILPELEHEVNTGKNFTMLRQIFYSQILATWYKKNLKQALLTQVYADKSTVKGVNLKDPSVKEKIYQQYIEAYKKGVFNYIKEDAQTDGQIIPRKYFSGGVNLKANVAVHRAMLTNVEIQSLNPTGSLAMLKVVDKLNDLPPNAAMTKVPESGTMTLDHVDQKMLGIAVNWSRNRKQDLETLVLQEFPTVGVSDWQTETVAENPPENLQFVHRVSVDGPSFSASWQELGRHLPYQVHDIAIGSRHYKLFVNREYVFLARTGAAAGESEAMTANTLRNLSSAEKEQLNSVVNRLLQGHPGRKTSAAMMAEFKDTLEQLRDNLKELDEQQIRDIVQDEREGIDVRLQSPIIELLLFIRSMTEVQEKEVLARVEAMGFDINDRYTAVERMAEMIEKNKPASAITVDNRLYKQQLHTKVKIGVVATIVFFVLAVSGASLGVHEFHQDLILKKILLDAFMLVVIGLGGSWFAGTFAVIKHSEFWGEEPEKYFSREELRSLAIDFYYTSEDDQGLIIHLTSNKESGRDVLEKILSNWLYDQRLMDPIARRTILIELMKYFKCTPESQDTYKVELYKLGPMPEFTQGFARDKFDFDPKEWKQHLAENQTWDKQFVVGPDDQWYKVPATAAMKTEVPGGIDLNSANMAMTVTKDAHGGVQVDFNPALIAQIRKTGVYSAQPVIVSVTAMSRNSLRPLLNLPQ